MEPDSSSESVTPRAEACSGSDSSSGSDAPFRVGAVGTEARSAADACWQRLPRQTSPSRVKKRPKRAPGAASMPQAAPEDAVTTSTRAPRSPLRRRSTARSSVASAPTACRLTRRPTRASQPVGDRAEQVAIAFPREQPLRLLQRGPAHVVDSVAGDRLPVGLDAEVHDLLRPAAPVAVARTAELGPQAPADPDLLLHFAARAVLVTLALLRLAL